MGYCPRCETTGPQNKEIRFTEMGGLFENKECPVCGECTGGRMIMRGLVAEQYMMSVAYDDTDPDVQNLWLDVLGVTYGVVG